MHYLSGMAGCLGRGINNKHRRQASIRSLRFDGKQKGLPHVTTRAQLAAFERIVNLGAKTVTGLPHGVSAHANPHLMQMP